MPRVALIVAADATEGIRPTLQHVMARGERVITLTTEIPGLEGHDHSGVDNHAVGRTAGHLMMRLARGEGVFVVITSQERRNEQVKRNAGFREVVGDAFAVRVHSTNDQPNRVAEIIASVANTETILGIYDTSHDESDLPKFLIDRADRPVWIAHERSPFHERCLHEGLLDFVLDQDAETQAACALYQVLREEEGAEEVRALLTDRRPQLRIFCRENL